MKTIKAGSAQQLVTLAKSLKITVPPREENRYKSPEAWSICSLLIALAETHHIKYPVKAIYMDKPDLDIIFKNDKVGVEITEAIPEDFAHAEVLAKRKYPDSIVDRSMFSWLSPRKDSSEIHRILQTSSKKLIGPGWKNDSLEREWAVAIFDTICIKLEKINKKDYRDFPRYWLIIYDNLHLSTQYLQLMVKYLRQILPHQPKNNRMFQYIFIEENSTLIAISKNGQLRYYDFDLHPLAYNNQSTGRETAGASIRC